MKKLILIIASILLVLWGFVLLSCTPMSSSGPESTISSYYQSPYGITVSLPEGWAAVEGPEMLSIKTIEGLISFNSWGQSDFWAKANVTNDSEGNPWGYTYDSGIVARQIPEGGAYIALVELEGQPLVGDGPEDYPRNDLRDLYQPHDWRQDSADSAYFKNFWKGGASLTLVVACSQNATDVTVEQINALLKSWRFNNFKAD